MKHARPLALSVLAIALLPGCDILDKIPKTPREAARLAGKFGMATRERVEETADGTMYRLMVESRRPATWLEADRAMWTDLKTSCPQGELHETVTTEPEDDRRVHDELTKHPAGTLFVRTVRCAPKFPFEFDIAADVEDDDAFQDMYRKLMSGEPNDTRQPMLSWLFANDFNPRYQQMQTTLALVVHMRLADCPDGVAIRNLTLGVKPSAPGATDEPHREALFGFTTECVAAPAEPTAAPAPGS